MENSNYKVNDIVKGIVVSIKNYGVFLSFDKAYIGLLHISEISSNFVNDINKYFHVGDVVDVLIKKVDENNKFLSVSLKDLPPSLNKYKDINPSKKITSYLKDIDFSKLEKALPNMIKVELEKESNTNEDWSRFWLLRRKESS